MTERDRVLNFRSLSATMIKNKTGFALDLPPIDLVVEPTFERRFNMSRNDFGRNNPISFTDLGQNAKGNLTFGNGRSQADFLELIYLLDFEQVTAEVPFSQEIVVGASGQVFNVADNAWEVSAAAATAEGNGMLANTLEAYMLDDVGTCSSAEVTREAFVASGPVTAGQFQQGADRQLRISNSLLGRTLKLKGEYSTTTLRLSDADAGTYTIVAKAVRSEDNAVGLFEAFDWAPDGTASHNPAGESAEIPGTFLFTGSGGCTSPYQFYIPKRTVVCLNS